MFQMPRRPHVRVALSRLKLFVLKLWRRVHPPKQTMHIIPADDIVAVQPMTRVDPEVEAWFHWCTEEEAVELRRKSEQEQWRGEKG